MICDKKNDVLKKNMCTKTHSHNPCFEKNTMSQNMQKFTNVSAIIYFNINQIMYYCEQNDT